MRKFCSQVYWRLKRIELYTQFDKPVTKQQLDQLHDLVKRAGQHEPVAYLTGKTEFYSLQLEVSPDCMIPRPETELLVERAIEFLRLRFGTQFVCDLCTGCGCIAVAIAKNFPHAQIIATDISDAALALLLRMSKSISSKIESSFYKETYLSLLYRN